MSEIPKIKTVEQWNAQVARCEAQILLVLPNISHALHALHKALSRGYSDSEMLGAILDLRNAAKSLEAIKAQWPQ